MLTTRMGLHKKLFCFRLCS